MFRVTERDERRSDATFGGESFDWPRKNEKRLTALFFADIDVAPTHRFTYPGAECFRNRLFARETRSQMSFREFHRHGILNFTICENTMKEPVCKSIIGIRDARQLVPT